MILRKINLVICLFTFVVANSVVAEEETSSSKKSIGERAGSKTLMKASDLIEAPCGVLQSFSGDTRVLDASRKNLIELQLRTPLKCGSWIAANHGWAHIRHMGGQRIHLGPDTLVQILDFHENDKDHLTLFKGRVYVHSGEGSEEFRVITATGRARVKQGKALVSFQESDDKTQLVALEDSASLENRFEPSRKITVNAGEMTELDFKLLRVIPILPKPVSVASLHPLLQELRVPQKVQEEAEEEAADAPKRRIASFESKKTKTFTRQTGSYLRHAPEADDPKLKSHMVRKLAGDEDVGERILYPDQFYGKLHRVQVEVNDVDRKFQSKSKKAIEMERKRLMEELSQIRVE